jgi:hypothetical protein
VGKHAIYIGRGFTPMHVTVVLDKKGWKRATKRFDDAGPYPDDLHASFTYFEGRDGYAPFGLITILPRFRKNDKKAVGIALFTHECVHAMQYAQKCMVTVFDDETAAYYVQSLIQSAWPKIIKSR